MGLEKRRRCGDFIAAFQYTKGASKQEGSRTFTVVGDGRRRGSGFELRNP